MSFDIPAGELYRHSEALNNEDESCALKHNVVHVAPSNRIENVRHERTGYDPSYERDIRFTKVAELLEEC